MKDREIDQILKRAAQVPHEVDARVLERVIGSIGQSMSAVHPRRATGVLVGGLVLISAAVALAGAALRGFHGIQKMNGWERASVFPALIVLMWLASAALVSETIPGSRRRVSPMALLVTANLALLAIFAVLFRDYRTVNFLHQGLVCLATGIAYAIPTAFGSWLLLRRGFTVNPVDAGLAAGTLAGLAGVTMLELHCPNFEALHVMVWHTAVILVSAAGGASLPGLIRRSNSKPSSPDYSMPPRQS